MHRKNEPKRGILQPCYIVAAECYIVAAECYIVANQNYILVSVVRIIKMNRKVEKTICQPKEET
jgi:hypothetical protein